MKVIALLPGRYHDDVGAIMELSSSEVKVLTMGDVYKTPAGLVVGAELKICDRVGGIGTFEERMKRGKAVGDVLRALADSIDGSIKAAEAALVGPIEDKWNGTLTDGWRDEPQEDRA